ncbi:RNA polymerase sigma factor [Pedobacter mendelii]|uniref:DNA-directed RNA polymerase sigma-70 factor n=1 Tax=Pedobacter mendelii TaxID=1908240 RepID=A0ABQ2BN77_9SPHI|nr:RNA polymerase sigma-70 factor [Pedobacter mendelii]GGI28665.1 DNA-directed RNA polymerase sigma-70 factor [Pedobacter mendelii]
MNNADQSDVELWERIKGSDHRAFDLLFERYWSTIYSTAFTHLKDQEICKEISHDIFLNIWKNRQVLEIRSMKSYLTTSARYRVYTALKKRKVNSLKYTDNERIEDYAGSTINLGEEKMLYRELEAGIESVLHTLPKRCKEIFCLSRFDNLSNQEISEKLGISKRSVENQITHAIKKLREGLKCVILF